MTTFTGGALEVRTEAVIGSFSGVEVRFRFDSKEGRFKMGWVVGGNGEVVTEPSCRVELDRGCEKAVGWLKLG